jgi:hypothetical protein
MDVVAERKVPGQAEVSDAAVELANRIVDRKCDKPRRSGRGRIARGPCLAFAWRRDFLLRAPRRF